MPGPGTPFKNATLLFVVVILHTTCFIAASHRYTFDFSLLSSRPFVWSSTRHNFILQSRGGDQSSSVIPDTIFQNDLQSDVGESVLISNQTNDTDSVDTTITGNDTKINYIFGASKPGDGSESDEDGLPTRFLLMQKHNRDAAKLAFEEHLAWRDKYDVNTILNRPHPKFDICKSILPHYFPGRDVKGNPIFVQRPGLISIELAEKNNVTMQELLMHYVYTIEYCWNILEPRTIPNDGVMTSVIDLTGVGWNVLQDRKILGFVKKFVKMMSENYPSRSHKTLIINSPGWFGSLYHLFKPLLRESTKKKIEIYSKGKKQDAALGEILGEASIPKELLSKGDRHTSISSVALVSSSGASPEPGPNSLVEHELRSFCMRGLNAAGMNMQQIV